MSNDTQHTPNIMARLFFEKFFVPRGLSAFFSGLGDFKDLRVFMPRGSGRHCFTVDRGCHRGDCRFFLQLRLTPVARARPSFSEANKTSLYILSWIYLFIIFFISYVVVSRLLDVCWMSVGCLLFGVLDGCSGVLLTCIFIGTYECYFWALVICRFLPRFLLAIYPFLRL